MKPVSKSIQAVLFTLAVILFSSCSTGSSSKEFTEQFPDGITRVWVGSEYWANRLQDWQVNNGRLECVTSQANRNINVLTWRLEQEPGTFVVSVSTGLLTDNLAGDDKSWMGLKMGARGQFDDYRDDAIYGKGLNAGITAAGDLFIGALPVKVNGNAKALIPYVKTGVVLKYELKFEDEKYMLRLSALDPESKKELASVEEIDVPSQQLYGSIALVSNFDKKPRNNEIPSCWFDSWTMKGSKLAHYPERAFGPILFSQYTLSRNILKLTAQMPPVGESDGQELDLQIQEDGKWKSIQKAPIDKDARTATFKIEKWDDTKDVPYRLAYTLAVGSSKTRDYYREGTFRKNPIGKDEFMLAAFTGNNDLGFPNSDVYESIKKLNPDLLFFSGDQIYEGVAGFGAQRAPVDKAILDYLRKWYLYGWEYGDLFRDIPSISIPDDHDVYHGNIWGSGGKAVPEGMGAGYNAQDAGGYKMPARWAKMVERTQTSNLPDPYDPTPIDQGIGVYYTGINYGGISFAITEDRKFKSAPKPLMPEAQISNGWAQNRKWDAAKQGDVKGAKLLGDRQLDFLEHWVADWSHGAKMKVLLSATILANVATLPKSEYHDAVVPSLRILNSDEYAPDDRPVSDMDSNGWPQTGRNNAVKVLRKGYAFHVAGDQHLGSFTKYGADEWRDGSYAFCVPAISNVWPRRWYPSTPGLNRAEGVPKYTGDYLDGFGNKISVFAVSNPVFTDKKPARLHDRSTGYGIVVLHKDSRDIESHCWPRFADPTAPDEKEYPGWPVTINQMDNYNRKAYGWLPTLKSDINELVVKVYNEKTEELVYALRLKGNTFDPPVFEAGSYRIEIIDTDKNNSQVMKSLIPAKEKGKTTFNVKL